MMAFLYQRSSIIGQLRRDPTSASRVVERPSGKPPHACYCRRDVYADAPAVTLAFSADPCLDRKFCRGPDPCCDPRLRWSRPR